MDLRGLCESSGRKCWQRALEQMTNQRSQPLASLVIGNCILQAADEVVTIVFML